jgi:thiamine-phosphate pyrophosphorylase
LSLNLPKVYPLTDVDLSGLSHAEQVRRLAAGGASVIQLREKTLSPREFFNEAKRALETAHELGVRLILNDRVDIALALRADGVHLGQDDLPVEAARKLLGADAIIGYSTHNISQALKALSLPLDYVAVGPIYKTTTKSDTSPVLGLELLRQIREAQPNVPIVGIGGITAENAAGVLATGADSVAMISGLLADQDEITSRIASLLRSLEPS